MQTKTVPRWRKATLTSKMVRKQAWGEREWDPNHGESIVKITRIRATTWWRKIDASR